MASSGAAVAVLIASIAFGLAGARRISRTITVRTVGQPVAVVIQPVHATGLTCRRRTALGRAAAGILVGIASTIAAEGRRAAIDRAVIAVFTALAHKIATA